jgi:hypothetical protein
MFVRTVLVGSSLAVVLSSTAAAQCGSVRRVAPASLARQIVPIIDNSPGDVYVSSTPSLTELAKQATDHYESRYQSCESHRIQNERWAAKQRQATRSKSVAAAPPARHRTKEELAASKFQAAHLLWQAGRTDAARRWLEAVLREYESTPTAERARITLAKL